ncbi:Imm8 family immunity protein [Avibacterium paragallinarum]|uniref:Imm8 family immunity protein n=1 Tax=Avibacterium paragallinarum TaxID=728 RepID=UPI00397D8794
MYQAELKFINYDFPIGRDEAQKACYKKEFCLSLCLEIGCRNDNAIEYFYLYVMDYNYLLKHEYNWGKNVLFVSTNNLDEIERIIKENISFITGNSWEEIRKHLMYYMGSEYDNETYYHIN